MIQLTIPAWNSQVSILFLVIFLFTGLCAKGQTAQDIQNIKVDELSDSQIESMMQQAAGRGYGPQDVIQIARMQGVPATEISKLTQRISAIQTKKAEPLQKVEIKPSNQEQPAGDLDFLALSSDPFGATIFNDKTRTLSFETNLRIPTPEDYIIGPDDQLQINIHGASERAFSPNVDNNGNIILQNIGPIHVSGLTPKAAEARIRRKLAAFYPDLNTDGPTYLYFSVAKVRNIKVNLVGEVKVPGTYTVNGLSTVMNALYVTGGPTELGTMRDIKVYRRNKLVGTFDIYDYLLSGKTKGNIRLQNDDVIMVGPFLNRVFISGEVKRTGTYELRPNENVSDALRFAGGFNPNAYKKAIFIERTTDVDKKVVDVMERQFDMLNLMPGDKIEVRPVIDRFQNRIFIKGAVFVPGTYELKPGMTISQLVEVAEGMRGDADFRNTLLTRTNADFSNTSLPIDLSDSTDFRVILQKEDVIYIPSEFDVAGEVYVEISGEVNKPGIYRYSDSLSVHELIIRAGGYQPSALTNEVEIVSNKLEGPVEPVRYSVFEKSEIERILLKPLDHLIIRRNPKFVERRSIQIIGEVNNPGVFYLNNDTKKLADVIDLAGGLKSTAFTKGASLVRKTEYYPERSERDKRYQDLKSLTVKYDSSKMTFSDQTYLDRIWDEIWVQDQVDFPEQAYAQAKRERLKALAEKNPFIPSLKVKRDESIPLDLENAIKSANSSKNLLLQNGDIIFIPKKQGTVRLRGNVLYPNTVSFLPEKAFRYYINEAGGFDNRSLKRNTYVVYANGSVDRTRSFLIFKKYPKIEPGSEIIVPTKPVKVPINPGQLVSITSGLTAMVAVIIQLVSTTGG